MCLPKVSFQLKIPIFVMFCFHKIKVVYEFNTFILSKDILLTVLRFFSYGTMMYVDRDGFLDLQNEIISR